MTSALVLTRDSEGRQREARVLLDTCATANFVTESFARTLNLPTRVCAIPICAIDGLTALSKQQVKITFSSRKKDATKTLNFLIVPSIAECIPDEQFPREVFDIPLNINLADPEFHVPRAVDMLFGAGPTLSLLSVGQFKITRGNYDLILQKTLLGWTVAGSADSDRTSRAVRCKLIDLNKQLTEFWNIEEIGGSLTAPEGEDFCEQHYRENTTRQACGRYVVKLPFKDEQEFGDSRRGALRRFHALQRRLRADKQLGDEYFKVMSEYIELGHITPLKNEHTDESAGDKGYYLPHHAVVKPSSSTTKVRVVFDASAKTDRGVSLNDRLYVGPTIQDKLFSQLIRFRGHVFAITADIEKMYRMVRIHPDHKRYLRLFWFDGTKIVVYESDTVTFGVSAAPFLAIRTLHQLANDEERELPLAAKITRRDFYVDNLLTGANTLEEVLELRDQIIELLGRGGFKLRQWSSNHQHALDTLDERTFKLDCAIEEKPIANTLGVGWDSRADELTYSVKAIEFPSKITKRHILSEIAKIFDPLGLLGPIILYAKSIIQDCWREKCDWDESLSQELNTRWIKFASQLNSIQNFAVDRRLLIDDPLEIEVHGFCDASERGYGACIYIRSRNAGNTISVRLACAKSRVAPLKAKTIPQLELCGALLLTRLYNEAVPAFEFAISKTIFWSDSTIVLHWIRKPASALKVFEGNRVSEIQKLSDKVSWRHVRTKDNPADALSRGQLPNDFLRDQRQWLQGPTWLAQPTSDWPELREPAPKNLPSLRSKTCLASCVQNLPNDVLRDQRQGLQGPTSDRPELREPAPKNSPGLRSKKRRASRVQNEVFSRFSSFTRMTRVLARCLRWRKANEFHEREIGLEEKLETERIIFTTLQREQFSDEITRLEKNLPLKGSKLATLDPFLDEHGILRVGGRLKNASIPFEQKFPILLPSYNSVTDTLIRETHLRTMHGGIQTTVYTMRLRFWLLDARNQVRKVVRSCLTCIRFRPPLLHSKMGDLPSSRVTENPVFAQVGVDFFGPIYIKEKKFRNRQRVKAYGCIFVCMATKAVHIEIVSDLTTEGFLAGFQRFTGRRGIPAEVFSDNGTNFVGANRQLQEMHALSHSDQFCTQVDNYAVAKNIRWHFNPPLSPHFGGLWEAGVKSFKHHFKRVIGEQLLTFEDINTLSIEIEAILNSRPLYTISTDPNDPIAITPAHFLIGRPLTALPETDLTHLPANRLSTWRFITRARQDFWKRWHLEYLNELQKRFKWLHSNHQLTKGSIVLLIDKTLPCMHWRLGTIVETHPGDDDELRVFTVKTSQGTFTQNVTQLCPLPFDQDE